MKFIILGAAFFWGGVYAMIRDYKSRIGIPCIIGGLVLIVVGAFG